MKATNKQTSKKRDSNIELFRIILMILIIAHHYVVNSGLLPMLIASPTEKQSVFLAIAGAFGKICINCFVLITGYFMCKSHITLQKFLRFVFEVIFYYVIIYFIFCATGFINFSIKDFLSLAAPIQVIGSDFTSAYIVLFLLIPFINILIKNLAKKKLLLLITILLFAYSFLGTIPLIPVTIHYVSWFFVIYLIGAYIRLHLNKTISSNAKLWITISIFSVLMITLSIAIRLTTKPYLVHYDVNDSNKILATISAVSFFMLFKNWRIKYNKFINYLAASTFGVLLIHASGQHMRNWLWVNTLNNVGMYSNPLLPLHLISSVLGVYCCCVAIDKVRIRFIEKPFFKMADPKIARIENKIKKWLNS